MGHLNKEVCWKPRVFASGLDVAAAIGSLQALELLWAGGETQNAHYPEQMSAAQQIVNDQPEDQWLNRFYSTWLYAFRPQVSPKDTNFFRIQEITPLLREGRHST